MLLSWQTPITPTCPIARRLPGACSENGRQQPSQDQQPNTPPNAARYRKASQDAQQYPLARPQRLTCFLAELETSANHQPKATQHNHQTETPNEPTQRQPQHQLQPSRYRRNTASSGVNSRTIGLSSVKMYRNAPARWFSRSEQTRLCHYRRVSLCGMQRPHMGLPKPVQRQRRLVRLPVLPCVR